MSTKIADVQAELEKAFVNWQFLPYTRIYPSRQACAQSLASLFNYSESFSDNGSVWLVRLGERPESSWFGGLRFLPLETEVFEERTARLEIFFTADPDAVSPRSMETGIRLLEKLHGVAREHKIRHISCAAYAGDTAISNAVETVGYRMTDSIASYHLPIKTPPAGDDPFIGEAVPAHVERLEQIAYACFSNRSQNINRFNSDIGLGHESVGRLYSRFVRDAVLDHQADLTLVYKEQELPTGFMTFKLDRKHKGDTTEKLGRAILSAVEPKFQGHGTYRKLLIRGCQWLSDQGITVIEGKTQLSNYRVIKVWQELGAELAFAYHTLHITL